VEGPAHLAVGVQARAGPGKFRRMACNLLRAAPFSTLQGGSFLGTGPEKQTRASGFGRHLL
jgi:hypothetical protein